MKKHISTKLIAVVVVLFAALFFRFEQGEPSPRSEKQISADNPVYPDTQYEVLEVIDGDTLRVELNGKSEKIRLLQVNTPEITDPAIPMGKAASDFTQNFLEGKKVLLEYDKEPLDQYGRHLCYVFVADENGKRLCLNEELVRSGLAKVVRYGSNTLHYDDYKKLEKEAKKQNLGIWQDVETNYPPKK